MNPRSRWLTVAALAAIFLAGAVTGWLVRPLGRPFHAPPRGADLSAHLRMRFARDLALTPQQMEKINPIIAESGAELDRVRRESEDRVAKVIDDMHAKIATSLTPEQVEKLAAIREKRRAMREGHGGK
jgi:Spy/CpxP family protein refolding chaperone